MRLVPVKQARFYVVMTGLLAAVMSVSACQKQETEADIDDSVNVEESVPMSAEPAEPSDLVVDDGMLDDPATIDAIADDQVDEIEPDTGDEIAIEADTDPEVEAAQ
ncbi:hypothetical protein J3492_11835 [Psychrobacter sp. F1192]|uniref:Secreted protein n=1 Tax=Psychrobacter coccoides TaxID=2818440 RepID=A0ABS3NR43_9GAMM|nr:hypothetical protein [Psychrobacter coccoides]MBO1531896.1 hypothetical protein [Psychrobacter coccoides]